MAYAFLATGLQLAIECPDRIVLLEESHTHLLSAEYAQAESTITEFQSSLGCGEPPTPQLLAHYWFVHGVWYRYIGFNELSESYLNQALIDGFWDDRYGISPWTPKPPKYESFLLSEQVKNGTLLLNQQVASAHTLIRTGPNLAQWVDSNGHVLDGVEIWASPKSVHYLSPNNSRWPALRFRNAAKWSAIASAGFSTLAIFQNYRMNQAESLQELDQRFGFQIAYGSLGILSAGLSAGFYLQYRLY